LQLRINLPEGLNEKGESAEKKDSWGKNHSLGKAQGLKKEDEKERQIPSGVKVREERREIPCCA